MLNALVMPKSALLDYVVLITVHLKWIWNCLLFKSFFDTTAFPLPEFFDSHDCAVCLCSIGEGDEVQELRCRHAFHSVCLDRWFGYGRATCPLCRNSPMPPEEVRREIIVIDYCVAGDRYADRHVWWLR